MPFEDKKRLLKAVFSGTDVEEKSLAFTLKKIDDDIYFTINGEFGEIGDKLPMTKALLSQYLE